MAGGRDKGDRLWTFSERTRWEKATKPKIFAPSDEPPLGHLLRRLKPDDFHEESGSLRPVSVITECDTVASFNWLNTAEPTIAVPGRSTQSK